MPPIAELGVVDAPPRRRSAAPARASGITHRQPSVFRRCGVRPPGRWWWPAVRWTPSAPIGRVYVLALDRLLDRLGTDTPSPR